MPVLRLPGARPVNLSPEQRHGRRSRISSIRQFADQLAKAKKLAMDRDSGKRKFDNMSEADLQLLEELGTRHCTNGRY